MNPWNVAVLQTADSLAALLSEPMGRVDLDVAFTARAAVLDHVSTVLTDIAPRRHAGADPGAVPVALIEADPLDSLRRVLQCRARPRLDRAPSELLDVTRRVDRATARWVDAGRYALLAARDWTGPTVAALDEHRAGQVVAEVAALAEAIAVLDRDLHTRAAARPDLQRVIESTTGLRVAAHHVLSTADTGESRAPAAPRDATKIKAALAARSTTPPAISTDVRRLTGLLVETSILTPHHVRACARVGRNLAILASGDAISPTGGDLRDELGTVARGLHTVATGDRGEFALNPVELRAFQLQLRHVHATTKLALAARTGIGPEEATRLARRIPVLVEILAQKTTAEVEGARWGIRDRRDNVRYPYAFASFDDEAHRPGVITGLDDAARAAAALAMKLTAPRGASSLGATLVHVLTQRAPRRAHPAATGRRTSLRPRARSIGDG